MAGMDQDGPFKEIEAIRELSAQVYNGLRNQQELLKQRELSLLPNLFDHVTLVDNEINTLEKYLHNDETELEQLRALTETSAMINSSLDPDMILAQAMDEIINLSGAERGYILLKD